MSEDAAGTPPTRRYRVRVCQEFGVDVVVEGAKNEGEAASAAESWAGEHLAFAYLTNANVATVEYTGEAETPYTAQRQEARVVRASGFEPVAEPEAYGVPQLVP
jgi:hypothetical protein